MKLRGDLFTGGIVLKEYVDLKLYETHTNEWRDFIFQSNWSLGIKRNSDQPEDCPAPPNDYLLKQTIVNSPFYSVDYAELANGSWTIIEVGDGQVSGLPTSVDPKCFYEEIASLRHIPPALSSREPNGQSLKAIAKRNAFLSSEKSGSYSDAHDHLLKRIMISEHERAENKNTNAFEATEYLKEKYGT